MASLETYIVVMSSAFILLGTRHPLMDMGARLDLRVFCKPLNELYVLNT